MKKAIILLFVSLILTGCFSKQPTPEERLSQYVSLWNEQKFAEMYELLSETAKNTITKEEFTERYDKIYQDLEISELEVQFKPPEEKEKYEAEANLAFSAKMNSAAGPIEFDHTATLVKEEENWFVDWNPSYIFPELGANDKINYQTVSAERGEILDRRGNGLAVNGVAMQIGIVPEKFGDHMKELGELLEMTEEQINNKLNATWVKPDLFVPLKNIAKDDVALQEKLFAIPGVTSMDVGARQYPYGEAVSHLIGFIAPVTAEDLERNAGKGYTAQSYIGKRGLEQVFESRLKGENGVIISIVKEDGTKTVLAEKEVQHGEDIQLTIDVVLQQRIYDQLKGAAGTGAALDSKTGETLALVSAPGFDPNAEVLGLSSKKRKALQDDPLKPYLNRFKLTYVPGSVIKPITAGIGLASGKLNTHTSYEITEKQWQPNPSWGAYKVTRYTNLIGSIDLEKALVYSDNIYFARAALDMGEETFRSGLKNFGFEEMNYPYPLEASKIGAMDSEIALADSGYGQGQIEMNVLHLAATYTPFVNHGNLIRPILLTDEDQGQTWTEGLLTSEQAAALHGMLTKVVTDPNGTAHSARIEGIPLAGKTGTAELKAQQGERGRELGWFVGYNEDLTVALMVEDVQNGAGSKEAVDRVKNIFLEEAGPED